MSRQPSDAVVSSPQIAKPVPLDDMELSPRRIAAFMVMVFGMFMAILDIQIVSASLPDIQAGLSASADEISWVQTSYLIAEVIMIPLSGFLARVMSTRIMFAVAAAGFTAASFMCALSGSIGEMILWRGLQGFLGGGMIPSVFAAAFTIFPPSKRAVVSPIIGLIATLAPTVGPTIGGYLSATFSWHWLFLINVFPGIGVAVGAWMLIDFDRPDWKLFNKFDWWGLAALAGFLGGMEFVLEEGPGNDWLDDHAVATMAAIMVVGGIITFWRAFTREEPIVDLSAFRDTNFAVGSVFSFTMGIGLYGLTYLYPLYLASIRGYDSLMIGQTVFVSGLAMFFSAPLAGVLSSKIDLRLMLLIGFVGFATSTWLLTGMTPEWDFKELFWPQVLRGMSLMLCMVPINNLALGTLPRDKLKGGSGLYNLMRNLGGAVGLAVINTVLTDRRALHYERLSEGLNWTNDVAIQQLNAMAANLTARGLDGPTGALMQMAARMRGQAAVLSFIDVFIIITVLFASLAFGAVLMKTPPTAPPTGASGH